MRASAVVGAAPVRHALLFALFTSVVMGVLFAVTYFWISSLLARHLDQAIEQQVQVLEGVLREDGHEALVGIVRRHELEHGDSPLHFLLQDADGGVLAGDLPPTDTGPGWHDITLITADGDGSGRHFLRGLGVRLGDDLFLLVTNDTRDLEQTQTLFLRSFGVALAVMVMLALGGGVAIGRSLLRRVQAVDRTARAIMEGDLSQRIPTVGPRDELGGLVEGLNRMLARIEELMTSVQDVTSNIAHDLRTPLSRLRQRLDAARSGPTSPQVYEAALDDAAEQVDALLRVFEALLRIAQIEAGARRARFAEVDLSQVAGNVVEVFAAVAEDEGRKLRSRVTPQVSVHGDRELLTQLIANLVENALQHTPAGTDIAVALNRERGCVVLRVEDRGPGIPPAERERVLTRFHRGDASRSTPGSGLGLSLVAAIARLHDARLVLRDNEPGLAVSVELAPGAAGADPAVGDV